MRATILLVGLLMTMPAAAGLLVVDTPRDGAVVPDRDVNISGTANSTKLLWHDEGKDFGTGKSAGVYTNDTGSLQLRLEKDCYCTDYLDGSVPNYTRDIAKPSPGVYTHYSTSGGSIVLDDDDWADNDNTLFRWDAITLDRGADSFVRATYQSTNLFHTSSGGWVYHGFGLTTTGDLNYNSSIPSPVSLFDTNFTGYIFYFQSLNAPPRQDTFGIARLVKGTPVFLKTGLVLVPDAVLEISRQDSDNTFRFYINGIQVQLDSGAWEDKPASPLLQPPLYPSYVLGASWVSTVVAQYDNLTAGYYTGYHVSQPFDTRSPDPYIAGANWSAAVPPGTGLAVQLRTNDTADMSGLLWKNLTRGAPVGDAKRFVQYRLMLNNSRVTETPSVVSLDVVYHSIREVMVSADGMNWTVANGTRTWNTTMTLAEGNNTLFVASTDGRGTLNFTVLHIYVDTDRPSGSFRVNGGAPFTASARVNLTFMTYDAVGVASVMVSENATFSGAAWINYTPAMPWDLPPGDGTKTLYAKFRDFAGRESDTANSTIVLDRASPSGTLSVAGGGRYATAQSVEVRVDASDNLSAGLTLIVSASENLTHAAAYDFVSGTGITVTAALPGGDGPHTLYAAVSDGAGNTLLLNSTVILDTSPPAGSILIDGGKEATGRTLVNLTISAADGNGVAAMRVGNSPDLSGLPWAPLATAMTWDIAGADGVRTVYAQFRDAAGLVSPTASDSILLTTAPPELSLSADRRYTNSTSITLGVSARDATGVALMRSALDAAFLTDTTGWIPWSARLTAALGDLDGEKTVFVEVENTAGTRAAANITVVKDTKAPAGTLAPAGGGSATSTRSLTLVLNFTDASPLVDMRVGEGVPGAWEPFSTSKSVALTAGDGNKVVRAEVRDAAGNTGIAEFTVLLDTTLPAITISSPAKGAAVTAKEVHLAGSMSDSGAGPGSAEYRLDGGEWKPLAGASWDVSVPVTDGIHYIEVRALDGAGNAATAAVTFSSGRGSVGFGGGAGDNMQLILGWLLAAVFAVAAAALAVRRRKPPPLPEPAVVPKEEETVRAEEPLPPPAAEPEPAPPPSTPPAPASPPASGSSDAELKKHIEELTAIVGGDKNEPPKVG